MHTTARYSWTVAAIASATLLGCTGESTSEQPSPVDSTAPTSTDTASTGDPPPLGNTGGTTSTGGTASGSGGLASSSGGASSGTGGVAGSGAVDGGAVTQPPAQTLTVHLVPNGTSGTDLVNFAVPLAQGQLRDGTQVRVVVDGTELPAGHRELASYPDGSVRSVQLQVEMAVPTEMDIQVYLGESPTAAALPIASVDTTLVVADGTSGPRVWAVLPADWLSASGVFGPQVTEASVANTPLSAWSTLCDYTAYDTDAFLSLMTDSSVWLYDRGTTLYRGYARLGDLSTLSSAYRETSIYRNGLTGTGSDTRIGIAGKEDDLKYHYTQNLALHYLLTGDERFRESAEDVATRVHDLWPDPGYAGGADFWTERHAGFGLLAYVWTMIVSDDRDDEFRALADEAVNAYLSVQETYPIGYSDTEARCFAHDAAAHGESFGYFGCSPWMSAILADALDAYDREADSIPVRESIVKLGRIIAREGRDTTGKPYYWMGVGDDRNEIDDYNEHWGESAYITAMAWYYSGQTDATLRQAADELVSGLQQYGEAPHMRSFNWQCRSAVATPWYLQ